MIYRTIERCGVRVSALGFGGSSLGGAFGAIDEEQGVRAVRVALELGINLFDTAPYYGATRAETVLGRALQGVPREHYVLATKVGRYGLNDFDFSADRVTRSVEESLQRLGVEHVDFLQAHDIEFGDLDQIVRETIPALQRIKAAGKARLIGITGLPIGLFQRVLDQVEVDQIQSYCHYTLNDRSLGEIVPYLTAKRVGIFNSAPLAMRLLSSEGPPAWHPAPAQVQQACRAAAEYCRARGVELGQLALRYSLACSTIHSHIVGMADPAVVRENIRQVGALPDPELLAGVQAILQPVLNVTWPSGRPENHRLPVGQSSLS